MGGTVATSATSSAFLGSTLSVNMSTKSFHNTVYPTPLSKFFGPVKLQNWEDDLDEENSA